MWYLRETEQELPEGYCGAWWVWPFAVAAGLDPDGDGVYNGAIMIRTNVHFADEQLRRLRAISDRTGISVAEHVRRAIDAYLRRDESRTKETAKR